MSLSMAPLLMHSQQVPAQVRAAIRAAYALPAGNREAELASAARILHEETGLECRDVRELVGLGSDADCK
jgi:ADP-ribose pyrophosphatase YjhB (NUDIX family)